MKKVLLIVLGFAFVNEPIFGQCNPYFDFEQGNRWEITSYNAKGKSQGRQLTEIKSMVRRSNGWDAIMHLTLYDKKDKVVYSKDVEMICSDGVVSMDMTRLIPDEQLQAFRDMNMKIEMDNLEIPSDLEPGMALDEGSVTISGDIPMQMTVAITNRTVEGKESITTSAGTFDCYKINYATTTRMLMNIEGRGTDWIAEGVGLVKTETYNSSGKLISYSVLTSR